MYLIIELVNKAQTFLSIVEYIYIREKKNNKLLDWAKNKFFHTYIGRYPSTMCNYYYFNSENLPRDLILYEHL